MKKNVIAIALLAFVLFAFLAPQVGGADTGGDPVFFGRPEECGYKALQNLIEGDYAWY